MSSYNTITTIDIWSSKIRTIIWHFDEEWKSDFTVLGVWVSDSNAIRKWNILDMEEFKNNLDKSLESAEKMAWEHVNWVYISFNSSNFDVITNKWVAAISWDDISQEDINRVLDMAKNWVDLPNRQILKVIPEYFVVDLEEWVRNPVWMSARKLEVVANIFSMNLNVLNNIKKAVGDVWIEVLDVYPNLLSSPEWVLTKRQKELWVVVIDIWTSTTWVTVYEEWVLKFASIIPMWWDSVTNDIALWLRTSIDVAEKLKIEYSELDLESVDWFVDEEIDLSRTNIWEELTFSRLYLSKIVTARYEEILFFVKQELKKIWKDWMLPEWAICVWWWSKQSNFIEFSKKVLKLPVFVWIPASKDELLDATISDPIFASVVWTLLLVNKYWTHTKSFSLNVGWMFNSIVKVFKKLLP